MVFNCFFQRAADFAETIGRFVNAVWRRGQNVHTSGARGAKSDHSRSERNISDRKFKIIKMLNLHSWVLRELLRLLFLWITQVWLNGRRWRSVKRTWACTGASGEAFKIKVVKRMFPVRFVWLFCQTCEKFTLRKLIYLLFKWKGSSYFTWTLLLNRKYLNLLKL